MPDNGSGSYSRTKTWIDDRNGRIKITADRHDDNDDDIADALTNRICKDGQTTTTQRIPFAAGVGVNDGAVGTPSINFTSDTNTGFYRIGADNVGLSLGGTVKVNFGATDTTLPGSAQKLGIGTGSHTIDAPIHVGDATYSITDTNPQILLARKLDDNVTTDLDGYHGFQDATVVTRDGEGTMGYASYDSNPQVTGTASYNHFAGYQWFLNIQTSGDVDHTMGFASIPNIDNADITAFNAGFIAFDPTGDGTCLANYAYLAREQTFGTTNYGFYSAGANLNVFQGATTVGGDATGKLRVISTDASGLQVDNGTNGGFLVDCSEASAATGVEITMKAAAGGARMAAISTATNEHFLIDAKGTGSVWFGGTSTGEIWFSRNATPTVDDQVSLGTSSLRWADLFLASGGVLNWNAGDVTITHSANSLAFAGASSGYTFDALIAPASNDGAALGSGMASFSDLFLASGGVINWNNGDVTATHSANALAFAGASSGYSFDAAIKPSANDGAALGASGTAFSDLFLAAGGIIDWGAGDVKLDNSTTNVLLFTGASSGYRFDAGLLPQTDDGAALGGTSLKWSDLFLANGGVVNFNNGNYTLTHSAGKLTASGDLLVTGGVGKVAAQITTDGAGAATVVSSFNLTSCVLSTDHWVLTFPSLGGTSYRVLITGGNGSTQEYQWTNKTSTTVNIYANSGAIIANLNFDVVIL